jgi:predicted CopG family antitoxin
MKTLMIKDEVYKKLSRIKGKKSFSELLDSMYEEKKDAKIEAFRKLKGILTDVEAKNAYKSIRELKKHAKVDI